MIAEFSDYECPYCREAAKTLRENVLRDYPTQVHVYFFDFPLVVMHPWAKPAAIAGRCVFRQSASAYWDFHDWIFENQKDITPENLKEKVLGFAGTKSKDIDAAQLTSCMDTKATEPEVDKTLAMGQSLNVNQTPTTFINGRRLAGRHIVEGHEVHHRLRDRLSEDSEERRGRLWLRPEAPYVRRSKIVNFGHFAARWLPTCFPF